MQLDDTRRRAHEAAVSAWQNLVTSAWWRWPADQAEQAASDLALQGVKEEATVGTRTTLDVRTRNKNYSMQGQSRSSPT